jgi:hypothetical protein
MFWMVSYRVLLTVLAMTSIAGCRTGAARGRQPTVTLVTDSTRYTVRQANGFYVATIGFVYANRSGTVVSTNYCQTPGPPLLEKNVDGRWVRAYDPVVLACLTIPPFRIPAGASYRGTLHFDVAQRGRNAFPTLEVDSIPGIYRLRWALHEGPDPDADNTTLAEAISNEFRFVQP